MYASSEGATAGADYYTGDDRRYPSDYRRVVKWGVCDPTNQAYKWKEGLDGDKSYLYSAYEVVVKLHTRSSYTRSAARAYQRYTMYLYMCNACGDNTNIPDHLKTRVV